MKKYTAILIAFIMIFSSLSLTAAFPAFADDPADTGSGSSVPDDAFDGKYTEFKGSDGSTTRVYDNGSVTTEYKDGTKSGVDYNGNQHSKDKEGNYTVRTTDGCSATEYADGRKSLTEPDGKTTTINTDGSFSESYRLGLTIDYDPDGGLTGIGVTGGKERIKTDENGNYVNGEISGPGGSKLTVSDDVISFTNSEGNKYTYSESGNTQTTTITYKDGSKCESTTTTTWADGKKTEKTDFTLTESNGDRWDSSKSVSYDENGEPVYSGNNVTQFTASDGSTYWFDNNSKAFEYRDPKTGTVVIVDKNGNLVENKTEETSINAVYDENGSLKSADITWKDGATLKQNPDGTASFSLPDGTKYTTDGSGNVWKNGVQIKKDGSWLPGEGTGGDDPGTEQGDDHGDDPGGSGIPAGVSAFAGIWSPWKNASGRAIRMTILSANKLKWEELYISSADEGSQITDTRETYERTYSYDPDTGIMLVQRTMTGKISVYDGEEVYLLSLRITLDKDEKGAAIQRWVMSPAEIEGGAENEYRSFYYLREQK